VFFTKLYSSDKVKEDEMDGTLDTHRGGKKCTLYFACESEETIGDSGLLIRLPLKWILRKLNVKLLIAFIVIIFHLTEDNIQWRTVMSTIIKL
jgi:hypothetical protein